MTLGSWHIEQSIGKAEIVGQTPSFKGKGAKNTTKVHFPIALIVDLGSKSPKEGSI